MQLQLNRLTTSALAIMLLAPAPASAQFGKLVKKAKEAAGIDKPTAAATAGGAAPSGPVSVNAEWQLSAATLDRFAAGLEADRVSRAESVKMLANMKTHEAYGQCGMSIVPTQEYQKVISDYQNALAKATEQEAQAKISQKFSDDLQALMNRRCGADPSRYPESQRQSIINSDAEKAALAKSGFTSRTYAVLKERIIPFCTADAATRGTGDVRLPASGRNVYYVYTAAEATELAPRCTTLTNAMRAVS